MTGDNSKTKVLIGEIVSAVGIKGEVKVKCYTSSPERFSGLDFVFCEEKKTRIEKAGTKGNMAVLKLEGISDRNQAEEMRGTGLYIMEDDLEELPEDTYYVKDLVGLKVISDEDNEEVGEISDVIQNTAQDIYVIKGESFKGDVMVPAVKEFIREVNVGSGYIRIKFIEGMLP